MASLPPPLLLGLQYADVPSVHRHFGCGVLCLPWGPSRSPAEAWQQGSSLSVPYGLFAGPQTCSCWRSPSLGTGPVL